MAKNKKGKHLLISACPLDVTVILVYSSTAACAAASLAIGTRKGEQLT